MTFRPMASVLLLVSLAMSACGQRQTADDANKVYKTADGVQFKLETVATGLEVPWAFAWLPSGDMLVTERPGRIRIIESGKLRPEPLYSVPDVEPSSESGLMDITLHPKFPENGFLYIGYAYNQDGKHIKVVRYRYAAGKFTEPKTIIDNIPGAPNHAGMRNRFGPDGKLYIATGDSTDWELAQKADSLAGKILRLNDDGSVPKDNPFVGKEGYRPEIWATGVRNPQGLAFHPGTGTLFETEHGPSGFEGRGGGADEVNIIEKGKNYGWPTIWGTRTQAGMEAPLLEYSPACAPASGAFYTGGRMPLFKDNFLFGCLRGSRIIRVILDGRKVVRQENLLENTLGRIREIETGPEGYLYFSTSNRDGRGSPAPTDDRIFRIVPAN